MGALRKVVVFRTLAQDQLESLANALEVESWRWEVEGGFVVNGFFKGLLGE